jgi:hypothetical protein
VLLVWVYYSAQIFLLGAEFTWVYAHRVGSRQGEDNAADRQGQRGHGGQAAGRSHAQPERANVRRLRAPQGAPAGRRDAPRRRALPLGASSSARSRAGSSIGEARLGALHHAVQRFEEPLGVARLDEVLVEARRERAFTSFAVP